MKFCKVSLFLALFVAVCLPAVAQTHLRLDIPFNFTAAGQPLPAGEYKVAHVFDGDLSAWRIYNDHASVTVLTNPADSPKAEHHTGLVFLRTGHTYSLVEVWPEEHFGRDVLLKMNVKVTLQAEGGTYVEVAAR